MIGKLHRLETLDGQPVTPEERAGGGAVAKPGPVKTILGMSIFFLFIILLCVPFCTINVIIHGLLDDDDDEDDLVHQQEIKQQLEEAKRKKEAVFLCALKIFLLMFNFLVILFYYFLNINYLF